MPSASAKATSDANLQKILNHVKGTTLRNKKLHVKTALVGSGTFGMVVSVRGKHGKIHQKWVLAKGTRLTSVHVDKKGHAYGDRVSFVQTPNGPEYVQIIRPVPNAPGPVPLSRRAAARVSTSWWNPISWGSQAASAVYDHVVKPCGNGMIDGYVSYESTYVVSQMLASGGALSTTTAIGVTNPEMLGVGILGTCMFGILRPKN